MEVTEDKTEYEVIGRWRAFFRTIYFAWKYPKYILIRVVPKSENESDFYIESAGLQERDQLEAIVAIGEHTREMLETQESLQSLINRKK